VMVNVQPGAANNHPATPESASQIVRHMKAGGRCMVQMLPRRDATITYPRVVEQARMDKNGEWYFGVSLWAFSWFTFPSAGLVWTLN